MQWKFNNIKEYVKFAENTYVNIILDKLNNGYWCNDIGLAIIKNVSTKIKIQDILICNFNISNIDRYCNEELNKNIINTRFNTIEDLKKLSKNKQTIYIKLFINNKFIDYKLFNGLKNSKKKYEIIVDVEYEKIENLIIIDDVKNIDKNFNDLIKIKYIKNMEDLL